MMNVVNIMCLYSLFLMSSRSTVSLHKSQDQVSMFEYIFNGCFHCRPASNPVLQTRWIAAALLFDGSLTTSTFICCLGWKLSVMDIKMFSLSDHLISQAMLGNIKP